MKTIGIGYMISCIIIVFLIYNHFKLKARGEKFWEDVRLRELNTLKTMLKDRNNYIRDMNDFYVNKKETHQNLCSKCLCEMVKDKLEVNRK